MSSEVAMQPLTKHIILSQESVYTGSWLFWLDINQLTLFMGSKMVSKS